jgi:hypothetical protein
MNKPASRVVRVRVTDEQRARIAEAAAQPPFNGNESLFIRWATETMIDVMNANGIRFWQVIADVTDAKAAA